jgi:hypothetical protein
LNHGSFSYSGDPIDSDNGRGFIGGLVPNPCASLVKNAGCVPQKRPTMPGSQSSFETRYAPPVADSQPEHDQTPPKGTKGDIVQIPTTSCTKGEIEGGAHSKYQVMKYRDKSQCFAAPTNEAQNEVPGEAPGTFASGIPTKGNMLSASALHITILRDPSQIERNEEG